MKLWTGRLAGELAESAKALNSSIAFDKRLINEDICGSMAHADMLLSIGVIDEAEHEAISSGLSAVLAEVAAGTLAIDPEAEDIHTFVEAELTRRIGAPGKKLHTGRSRNDQTALDLRLWSLGAIDELDALLRAVVTTLCTIANEHTETVMPGYTHLQRAQPVTLGHHLSAYAQMLLRDIDRLADARVRTAVSPLGSGALAGSTYPLDRRLAASALGLCAVTENSMDGVSDRDFVIELCADLSIVMLHLSRFAEELVLWSSFEFGFVTLPDGFVTGSSMMPQKKNPDIPELIRGKTGRVYGSLMTLLTMQKGLPLCYNKDMQEDKEALFDAVDTAKACLCALPPMLAGARFHPEAMLQAAQRGFINATDCADYLAKKGMPFRDAYRLTGELVNHCTANGFTLETLPIEQYKHFSELFSEDVYAAVDLLNCVKARSVIGAPAPERVREQIEKLLCRIAADGME